MWKQQLYAFLLRRVLGPILTSESNRKLHKVIDISFHEGRFVITDVELNPALLESSGFHVLSTFVKRLEIQMSLEEEGHGASNSLAWRAFQLTGGNNSANGRQPAVSLIASLLIDGLDIRLLAAPFQKRDTDASVDDADERRRLSSKSQSTAQAFLSTYVEAALSSLRLSVTMTNTRVRVVHQDNWLECCIKQVLYEDRVLDDTAIFHKRLVVQNIFAATGYRADASSRPLVLVEGSTEIRWRLMGSSGCDTNYGDDLTLGSDSSEFEPLTKHDVRISMAQNLHVSIDTESLLRIQSIARCFTQAVVDDTTMMDGKKSQSTQSCMVSDDVIDQDFQIIDGLMKQYQVARLLAERKEIRGGILVPYIDPTSPDRLTFDTFFDANEFSVSKYSSFLKESLCLGSEANKTAPDDWVQASIQLHFDDGDIKITFSPDRIQEEYLLTSFSGLDVEANFMREQKEFRLCIRQFEVEDAHVDDGRSGLEIGSLLRFHNHPTEDEDVRAEDFPCIELTVKVTSDSTLMDQIEIEATFAAMELNLHMPTMLRCQGFLLQLESKDTKLDLSTSESIIIAEESNYSSVLALYVKIECIEMFVPLSECKNHWDMLYGRCAYTVDYPINRRPALGFTLDQLLVECAIGKADSDDETTITIRNVVVFANSPIKQNSFDSRSRRVDICSFCGRAEVEPCIPISIRIVSRKDGVLSDQPLSRIFPKVVDISSFKARQAEDNETDTIFSPNPEDEMARVTSSSRCAIFVFVPELILDVDVDELRVVHEMTDIITQSLNKGTPQKTSSTNRAASPLSDRPMSILVDFDFVTSLVRGGELDETFCMQFTADRLQCHISMLSDYLLQSRVILQNFSICEGEISKSSKQTISTKHNSRHLIESRQRRLKERMSTDAGIQLKPILYRSHLFEPISSRTPALLIDFVNDMPSKINQFMGRKFHVTLYDATYRFDYDSRWLQRLKRILTEHRSDSSGRQHQERETSREKILTRMFVSFVDINVDYLASPRFPTASRTIVRVGDFRVSGNVVAPMQDVQKVKFSLGDVSVFLCNDRFPYSFENRRLRKPFVVIEDHRPSFLFDFGSKEDDSDPKLVFQKMNPKTVATLDALEGSVTLKQSKADGPPLMLNLSVGEISIFACKDSFACLVGTVSELATEISAVTTQDLDGLRLMSSTAATGSSEKVAVKSSQPKIDALSNLRERSALRPAFGCPVVDQAANQSGFLLDGYDWTTIDSDETGFAPTIPPDEEQTARWYPIDTNEHGAFVISSDLGENAVCCPDIVADHFTMNSVINPLEDGDMGVAKYVKDSTKAKVSTRLVVHDLAFKLRLFDGYDWPKSIQGLIAASDISKRDFIIPEVSKEDPEQEVNFGVEDNANVDPKAVLLEGLLQKNSDEVSPFRHEPLPEERAAQMKENAHLQLLSRRTNSYLQFYASGVSLRVDSLKETVDHRLASCLDLTIRDFFLAETISSKRPVKMIGEWFNEDEHPRDSNEGLLSLKMVAWHPEIRVNLANEIASDECEVVLQFLPLRCLLDQRAIAFARAFFHEDKPQPKQKLMKGLHQVPPPMYKMFRVLPLKLKVDYWPQKLNPKALRDGAIVELINISPLDGMILTLKQVEITDETGVGAVASILVGRWVTDICSTQLLQFVTKARPLEPITQLSGAATDMIVLPWEAFQNGESIQKALRSGVKGLSKTLAYELLTISSKTAQFLAGNASRMSIPSSAAGDFLPSRPMNVPRGFFETAPHAFESINRGLQAANHRIVIVPYREFHRNGTTGAVKSVIRGIPVALAAPASGAAEALSFALIGVRNQVRPDIRREEEASAKGLDR